MDKGRIGDTKAWWIRIRIRRHHLVTRGHAGGPSRARVDTTCGHAQSPALLCARIDRSIHCLSPFL